MSVTTNLIIFQVFLAYYDEPVFLMKILQVGSRYCNIVRDLPKIFFKKQA